MTACGTIKSEYVSVKPVCEPVPRHNVKTITNDEAKQMNEALRKKVVSNTIGLINNVKANEKIIRSVCDAEWR